MEQGYFVMDKPQTSRYNNDSTSFSFNPSGTVGSKMPRSLSVPCQQPPSYTNDYLTPVSSSEPSSAHAQPPQLPAFPPGGFARASQQTKVISRDGEEHQNLRADSGIDVDYKRGPLSSTSTNPRSSTIYECIDSNNQYTDPSPHSFHRGHSAGGETSSSGVSSVPTTALLPSVASDSEDGLDDNDRHRLHPAYTSLNQSSPQLYTETCGGTKAREAAGLSVRHLRYLWCGLAILTLITVVLLAIITYAFVFLVPEMQARIRTQEGDLRTMESDYQLLSQKVDALLLYHSANQTENTSTPETTQVTMAKAVAVKIAELNDSVREFGSQLQQLGADLQFQINNISLVPAFKGVTAVGSLSSCFYYSTKSIQALPGPASTTSWLPRIDTDQLRDNVVMSASCGVQGGTLQFVETIVRSPDRVQYRCNCDGHVSGHDRRVCHIHLVLCPRRLPVDLAVVPPN